jgi:hypothetical protein
MHLFGGANDRINRTCLNAECAANTLLRVYKSNWPGALNPTLWSYGWMKLKGILGVYGYQNLAQALKTLDPTRRAAIWERLTRGHCLGISTAIGVAAFSALGLWKNIFQLVNELVRVNHESANLLKIKGPEEHFIYAVLVVRVAVFFVF